MTKNKTLLMERLVFSGYNLGMRVHVFVASLVLIGLTACTGVTVPSEPSLPPMSTSAVVLVPSSTRIPPSPEPSLPTHEVPSSTADITSTFTLEPTSTDNPLPPTLSPPLALPTSTEAATAIPQPAVGSSALQFLGPGPLSELVSPFYIYGYAIPGFNQTGTVTLYGEDGRVLTTQLLALYTANNWAWFSWPLHFQVQGAGELGRLSMSTQDEYGRLTALYSVHLILLPEGNSIVTPPGDLKERCIIDQPVQGRWLSGRTLQVAGKMRPFNNLPLVVELIDRDGNRLASQLVLTSPAADDSFVPFQVSLPYTITSGTWARLSVSQADVRISGMMYLYSEEIFLHP